MLSYTKWPEDVGISSAGVMSFLDALEASGLEFHGLMMLRHGKVALDMNWSPYDGTPHAMHSLSKSFTSAAVGFAVAEGRLRFEDRVCDLLSDKLPENPSENLKAVTVEHLLMMGSGLDPKSDSIVDDDWVKHVLSFPVLHTPGTVFHYNSLSTYLAAVIVQRLTGETLVEYLMPRLFLKLGIPHPHWDSDPKGYNIGGFGLYLTTDSIAKFGQLLLQDGMWKGERVLPEGWVQRATQKHISNGDPASGSEWAQGYGYQFWRCTNNIFRGDGANGQICLVAPDKDTVIAVTAGLIDMGAEMALLQDKLLAAVDMPASDLQVREALAARIDTLAHPFPVGDPLLKQYEGTYESEDGDRISFVLEGNRLAYSFSLTGNRSGTHAITLRYGNEMLVSGVLVDSNSGDKLHYLASYAFEGNTLRMLARVPAETTTQHVTIQFDGDTLVYEAEGVNFQKEKTIYRRVSDAG